MASNGPRKTPGTSNTTRKADYLKLAPGEFDKFLDDFLEGKVDL